MQLLNGDSYNLIKSIPDNSIDLIVTDPPYLIENTDGEIFGYYLNSEIVNLEHGKHYEYVRYINNIVNKNKLLLTQRK